MPRCFVKNQNHGTDSNSSKHQRANRLLNELFELSKMDSPDFALKPVKTDICETLRQICAEIVPHWKALILNMNSIFLRTVFTFAGHRPLWAIIQNLTDNAVRYNPKGTTISVSLTVQNKTVVITSTMTESAFPHISYLIFSSPLCVWMIHAIPNWRQRLGLSIAKKISQAHGGNLILCEDGNKGCNFKITIPII
jgi:signal transduction histidine kinase